MRKVQMFLSYMLTKLKNKIDRFGYPIVSLTAPKLGVNFKVDRNDPAFQRPYSEVEPKKHLITV